MNSAYRSESQEYLSPEVAIPDIEKLLMDIGESGVFCTSYLEVFGMDIALEALKDVLDRQLASRDEILRTAEVCRAKTVITPYMEAMSV